MRKTILILLAVVAVAGVIAYTPQAKAEMPRMCHGFVYYDGSPVASATINLYTDRWCLMGTCYSTETGAFGVSKVTSTPGYYRLCIRKDNKWQHVRFYFDGTNDVDLGTIVLVTSLHSDQLCPD